MKKTIDVVIPIRDRDQERVEKCVKHLRKGDYLKDIFLVDNSLKTPLKEIEGATIIRVEYDGLWNKSWLINLGIKKCTSEFLMTLDVDILLNTEILEDVQKFVDKDTVIFNKNVRRIEPYFYSEDYEEMVGDSKPWAKNLVEQVYTQANGGLQVMAIEWIKRVNGYDENAGLLWGGMDNRVAEQAILDGRRIIDLNLPMLHLEHPKKEKNLEDAQQRYGLICRSLKRPYLNDLISKAQVKNLEGWGGGKPNDELMRELTDTELKKENDELEAEVKKATLMGNTTFNYRGQKFNIQKDETKNIPVTNK